MTNKRNFEINGESIKEKVT